MSTIAPRGQSRPRVLATDLDGTFIPLAGDPTNVRDLHILRDQLAAAGAELVFVTGRHLASIRAAIAAFDLPRPKWIVADVGSTIHAQCPDDEWAVVPGYVEHLDSLCAALPLAELRERLAGTPRLRPQEDVKQGRFKLSYYAPAERLDEIVVGLNANLDEWGAPYSLIASVDPFNGDGLIDLLPRGVSKAYALHWWTEQAGLDPAGIVFAGDSGNDLAAMLGGYRTIVVGNADRRLARRVCDEHRARGWSNRLFLAEGVATSGVLEGCRWFGLVSDAGCEWEGSATERILGVETGRTGSFPSGPSNPDGVERGAEGRVGNPSYGGGGMPLGATPVAADRTLFRVWAPGRTTVEVQAVTRQGFPLAHLRRSDDGHFTGILEGVGPGAQYVYRLDGNTVRPDPRSRFQPGGPHGPSQVVDPGNFPWQDANWSGVPRAELVVYELHVGSFTEQGTFAAAVEHLDGLRDLGITAIELLPVAQTPGRWNWGYDGVNLFAVGHAYGTPDDLRALVDAAHARGLAVLLDVVYNHVGPEGNYLSEFGPYASTVHHTPWGDALNFDGPGNGPVRRFVVENALYWLREYHLDGLRLDAVNFMLDEGEVHVLDEIRTAVTAYAETVERTLHLIAETNTFNGKLLRGLEAGLDPRASEGAAPYDGSWADDFAHAVYSVVAPGTRLTPRRYHGANDLAEVLRHGCLYEGPVTRRLTADDRLRYEAAEAGRMRRSFVVGVQTHDVVGNEAAGRRLHQLTSPAVQRAAAALALLSPSIPLIFMGEETANSSPFPFYTDFEDERLRQAVERGRRAEYPQHLQDEVVSPIDPATFESSRLGPSDDPTMRGWYRDLLALRREWQANGWLDPTRISVAFNAANGLFAVTYALDDGRDAFVLARLASEPVEPIEVEIDGEVLLDSDPRDHAGPTTLTASRALVGRGRVRFADAVVV